MPKFNGSIIFVFLKFRIGFPFSYWLSLFEDFNRFLYFLDFFSLNNRFYFSLWLGFGLRNFYFFLAFKFRILSFFYLKFKNIWYKLLLLVQTILQVGTVLSLV